jgi:hypothetical protein
LKLEAGCSAKPDRDAKTGIAFDARMPAVFACAKEYTALRWKKNIQTEARSGGAPPQPA